MTEQRYNNQAGTLGQQLAPATAGTSQSIPNLFSTAPNFATLTGNDYIKLVFDYGTGNYEIDYLTGYTSGSVGGIITRAAEDSTNWPAVSHSASTGPQGGTAVWATAPTANDFAGLPIVRQFPFAYNSSGISSGGFAVYTPNVGDVLLDAWMEIDTAWNGTTPFGDIGWASSTAGLFRNATSNTVDMTAADTNIGGDRLVGAGGNSLSLALAMGSAVGGLQAAGATSPFAIQGSAATFLDGFFRFIPLKFESTNSVNIWVTQNGRSNGSDPVASQGSGILYLVTATPL